MPLTSYPPLGWMKINESDKIMIFYILNGVVYSLGTVLATFFKIWSNFPQNFQIKKLYDFWNQVHLSNSKKPIFSLVTFIIPCFPRLFPNNDYQIMENVDTVRNFSYNIPWLGRKKGITNETTTFKQGSKAYSARFSGVLGLCEPFLCRKAESIFPELAPKVDETCNSRPRLIRGSSLKIFGVNWKPSLGQTFWTQKNHLIQNAILLIWSFSVSTNQGQNKRETYFLRHIDSDRWNRLRKRSASGTQLSTISSSWWSRAELLQKSFWASVVFCFLHKNLLKYIFLTTSYVFLKHRLIWKKRYLAVFQK